MISTILLIAPILWLLNRFCKMIMMKTNGFQVSFFFVCVSCIPIVNSFSFFFKSIFFHQNQKEKKKLFSAFPFITHFSTLKIRNIYFMNASFSLILSLPCSLTKFRSTSFSLVLDFTTKLFFAHSTFNRAFAADFLSFLYWNALGIPSSNDIC